MSKVHCRIAHIPECKSCQLVAFCGNHCLGGPKFGKHSQGAPTLAQAVGCRPLIHGNPGHTTQTRSHGSKDDSLSRTQQVD